MSEDPFERGDGFWIEPIRGNHFIVVFVNGPEVEVVDVHRRPWNMEVDEDGGAIYPTEYGPAVEFTMDEVHFE